MQWQKVTNRNEYFFDFRHFNDSKDTRYLVRRVYKGARHWIVTINGTRFPDLHASKEIAMQCAEEYANIANR